VGQPWGLSGPQFLGVYAVGIVAIIVIPIVFRQFIRGLPGRGPTRDLDPYEVAYLAGGAGSVAQVLLAGQVDSGALRVDSAGRVSETDRAARTGPHAAALDRISPVGMPDGLTTAAICGKLKSDPCVARIRDGLRANGMMISAGRIAALRCVTAVLVVALLLAGIARMIEGHQNHRPISYLVTLWILSLIIGAMRVVSVVPVNVTTRRGRAYLRRLRKTYRSGQLLPSRLAVTGAPVLAGAAAAFGGAMLYGVALSGFGAVPDEDIRRALQAGMPAPSSASSSSSSCSSSSSSCSSSSCGGGGCGGGGCGG
jgi:uncharacterized protein (TIGR04222 family)